MKKLSTVITGIFLFVILISPVKADTTNYILPAQYSNNYESLNIENAYNIIRRYNYNYYAIGLSYTWNQNNEIVFNPYYEIIMWNEATWENTLNLETYNIYFSTNDDLLLTYVNSEGNETQEAQTVNGLNIADYEYYILYDTNYNFISSYNLELTGFYQDNIIIEIGDIIPTIKNMVEYSSWSEYENNHLEGYITVNLDNYEYVLLSLKNYNQTQPFQTNLQVKGQIGITPIYNFGQTSKDAVTGAQVQDRCNVNYQNYTSYPFYIIQSDLQNNSIYAVKECSEGSSFKFDSSIFDVTYVTSENEGNPTITINGNTYDVIPYGDLPSTATKNEEDNYIPGESGSATDNGGLDSAIKGAQQKLSEIWNTMTYFTDFIGQIFSSLPSEVHTILLSAFTIMIILGIIKIFLGK